MSENPSITFHKERLDKDAEHKHCCLCRYGKKKGIILWRVEFRGEFFGFHWLLCNRCRFRMFVAMGGKRINRSDDWKNLVAKPEQKVSSKGKVRSSFYWSCSWDRREAMDKGVSVKEYESKMNQKMDKARRKKKKRKGTLT